MLIAIILHLVSLAGPPPAIEEVASPRAAQVRLAELLGGADSIDSITTADRGRTITFAIARGDAASDVVAHTDKRGEIVALEIVPATRPAGELGPLTWLAPELVEATAVTQLVVDEDAAITIATSDGRRYMVIPGRGSGGPLHGNAAVEARWAAEWNHHRG